MRLPSFWRDYRRGLWAGFCFMLSNPVESARELWCELTHGGGKIERDEQGRINWQCSTCGRWSRYPVELDAEWKTTNAAMRRSKQEVKP